ncbi:LppW family protein [Modestobacter sp. I12A-02628]|uniref:LppW family protein n=1 Tax=Goekera deserti TaxID=2497753 RepID=A0A7K3WEX8_9ACTN|nr:serine hydrolase [Goekera deserti]MPQ96775.1 LppW family protein [Goekera deserti]NDI46911.1 LppW family protein [Goekera deserti]NEL54479.1 LppW family protein [Goekera deserti]
MTRTSLQPTVALPRRAAAPTSERSSRRTAYRRGRPVRRRRGAGGLAVALSAVLAGWLAAHSGVVDVSALRGRPPVTAASGGEVSVVVLDGSGAETVSEDAGSTHWTASLAKLFVVQQLLEQDEAGTLTLDDADRALMERAVEVSDDQAMNSLWQDFGGAQLVTAAAEEFGLDDTAPPARSGRWGETTTTAADFATFLSDLGAHLSAQDLATMTAWMRSAAPTAADGFDQSFGLLSDQADTEGAVAGKQGWMCCLDDRRQLHSTGVLTDGRVVVLLGEFPAGTSWQEAQAALTATAESVVESR